MIADHNEDDIKTIKQGARCIGVSPITLHRIMRRGEIGYFRIGSRIVFSREKHLIPFLLKNEVSPTSTSRVNRDPDSVNTTEE